MRDVRWGMIGVGSVAEHKSGPAFARARGGRLAGVASRRHEAAMAYADRHAVERVFSTPTALIESADIDAVYIATPPSSHAALALQIASTNKPCCIEKPMAVLYSDAEAIRNAFDAAGMPLFVSYYRRSLPRFLQVAQWIAASSIGAVREVSWELKRKPSAPAAAQIWRIDAREAPGGLFEDLACHGLDLFDMLLGPIRQVDHARLTATDDAARVPDRVQATWRHGDRIKGVGDWNFAADERADAVTITGDAGTIRFSMFEDEPIEVVGREGTISRNINHPVPIQLHHVEAMNAQLMYGQPHPSTAESAIRTAWVTDRILRGPATEVHGFRSGWLKPSDND